MTTVSSLSLARLARACLLLAALLVVVAQSEMLVDELEGSAQIQIEGERVWRQLKGGEMIRDNDVIKTGYRSKLMIRMERLNFIIAGSNTKILINHRQPRGAMAEVAVTLFEGALVSNISANIKYTVYTTSASATTQSGHFSSIVEEKTGRTGFQVLKGKLPVRNLVIQGENVLQAGGTSVIDPSQPPTPAKPITTTHVEVLGRFFGKKYVSAKIKESGIKPVKAKKTKRKRLKRSRTLGRPKFRKYKKDLQEEKMKPQFDLNFILGKIQEDSESDKGLYKAPTKKEEVRKEDNVFGTYLRLASFESVNYPFLGLRAGMKWEQAEFLLHFPFVPSPEGNIGTGEWSDAAALLEKIETLRLANERSGLSLHMGKLKPLTHGYGLSTESFVYALPTAAVQPTGLQLGFAKGNWTLEMIAPDVLTWELMMPSLTYDNGLFFFLFLYIIDRNQYLGLHPGDVGFLQREFTPPNPPAEERPLDQFDLQAAWNIYFHPPFWFQIYAGLSQMRKPEHGNVGYGAILPGFSLVHGPWKYLLELRIHNDRFTPSYFGPFFGEDRAWYVAATESVHVQEDRLIDSESAKGMKLGVARSFDNGLSFNTSYMQNLFALRNAARDSTDEPATGTSIRPTPIAGHVLPVIKDAILRLQVAYVPPKPGFVRNAEWFYDHFHGGYYDYGLLGLSPRTRTGFNVSMALSKNWELVVTGNTYFIDKDGTNRPESMGTVIDTKIGINRYF